MLHQEDDIAFSDNFDFSDSIFELVESDIPKLSQYYFSTPSTTINNKFKNLDHLLKVAHVNARSLPKHIHEIQKILDETGLDILGISETFIAENTPESICQIPGYKYIN